MEIRINYRADFAHGIFFITVLHTSILVWNATVFPNPERMDFHSEHYNGFRCLENIMAFLPGALDLSLEGWGSLLKVWEGSFLSHRGRAWKGRSSDLGGFGRLALERKIFPKSLGKEEKHVESSRQTKEETDNLRNLQTG